MVRSSETCSQCLNTCIGRCLFYRHWRAITSHVGTFCAPSTPTETTHCISDVERLQTRARADFAVPLVTMATQRPRPPAGVAADVSRITMATEPPAWRHLRVSAADHCSKQPSQLANQGVAFSESMSCELAERL